MKKLLIFFQMCLLLAAPMVQAAEASNTDVAQTLLRSKGCINCHVVPGFPAPQANIAPRLEGLSKRRRIAGGVVKNTPENLRKWLKNPKALKSFTLMPNTALTDTEVEILVDFLMSLK